MKVAITITGDNHVENDRKFFRELNALLNSTSYISTSVINTPSSFNTNDDTDDEETGAPANVQPGEVDAAGFPWDERIHSGGKTKSEAGVWRNKKGLTENVKNAVIAELRSLGYGVTSTAAPTITPPIQANVPIPQPVAAPVPQPAPQPVGPDFPTVMALISKGASSNPPIFDGAYISWLCQNFGLGDNLTALASRPDLIAGVYEQVKVDTVARGGTV